MANVPSYRAPIEFARTADGWDLALHRYAGTRRDWPPLVLSPGYGCNRHFFDSGDRYSLARFLAGEGFDTWVLELRGHGLSEPAPGQRRRAWSFDDLVFHDAPAALSHVAERTGRRSVWIGHSLGGMVAYAALGCMASLSESVAGLVTLGTPVSFPSIESPAWRRIGQVFSALPIGARLPQRGALVAFWTLGGWSSAMAEYGMNRANLDRQAFGHALPRLLENLPGTVVRQLAQWSLSGECGSRDGAVDYRAGLQRITTPALIIGGAADHLAPPATVRSAYDRIGSSRKQYREFGTSQGDSADYGHVDLIFGRHAPEEVFPVISRWIASEAAAQARDVGLAGRPNGGAASTPTG